MQRLHRSALALSVVAGLLSAGLHAQSTTGALTGQAPAGDTVLIQSNTGLSREVPVDERGRYLIPQLPLGTYKVFLKRDGRVVDSREGVTLIVNANTDVSFGADATELGAVTVTASRLAGAIDVGSVDSRTVVTSQQLEWLPLAHSAEAIAKLAPGVVGNAAGFTGPTGDSLVSFGGASVSENAYYINGFNSTDPLSTLGGLTLPYGAIDQQEIFTGGYSAKYGRSAGGVINAVGKRGSNDWHFGGQLSWEPSSTRKDERDVYYPGTEDLYQPSGRNEQTVTTRSVYAGGPIVENRLFFYGAYELEKVYGSSVGNVEDFPYDTRYSYDRPRWYAKLDWNISDDHLLEITGASARNVAHGNIYAFDFDARERGEYLYPDSVVKTGGDFWNVKYTGYLTDRLTVSAQYGKSSYDDYNVAPASDDVFVGSTYYQNPAYVGDSPVNNTQLYSAYTDPNRRNRNENLRFDVNYAIGNHSITLGIDNQKSEALHYGEVASGPTGYYWEYGWSEDPGAPLSSGLGIPATIGFANGEDGYYVIRHDYDFRIDKLTSKQTAQFVEDNWQVTDNLLLNLGLRLDQFTNYNANGDAYIKQSSGQWAPRLGFSWDVRGDSTFKLFGNAGRYYLALPLRPAIGAATAVLWTQTYYTYGGVDENGYPTGLTQMAPTTSLLNYYGNLPDPRTVAARGIKPAFQDEFILGFSKTLGDSWVYGAKATYRTLRSGVDDYCDRGTVFAKAAELGYDVADEDNPTSCWLFNPGKGNVFNLVDTGGNIVEVPLSKAELRFPDYKRDYYALNLALEHPFDGTWYAKLDYTLSRSEGTTEGQVLSRTQQNSPSVTMDWDFAELMEYSDGPQANDHRHQFKLYGYWQIAPEWLVSANLSLVSGAPRQVMGTYVDPDDPDNNDPAGYGGLVYHFYQGQPAPPGSQGRLPWMKQLDLGVSWKPAFAGGRLKFGADLFNVFNGQAPIYTYPYGEFLGYPLPLYGAALIRQQPRYLRLSVSYDY
ncbi:MAG: TonB-dependent receptor [Pseudoxanthomonas sp.]